jgi:hypothetical protein
MCRGASLALFALLAAACLLASVDARNKIASKTSSANGTNDADNDKLGRSPRPRLSALGGDRHTFEVANDTFLLDGEPFRILSGE